MLSGERERERNVISSSRGGHWYIGDVHRGLISFVLDLPHPSEGLPKRTEKMHPLEGLPREFLSQRPYKSRYPPGAVPPIRPFSRHRLHAHNKLATYPLAHTGARPGRRNPSHSPVRRGPRNAILIKKSQAYTAFGAKSKSRQDSNPRAYSMEEFDGRYDHGPEKESEGDP